MPKDFPRYIIDRSRSDPSGRHPHEYAFCYHKKLACICEIIRISGDFPDCKNTTITNSPEMEIKEYFIENKQGGGRFHIRCIHHLYPVEWTDEMRHEMRNLLRNTLHQYIYRPE